MVNVFLKNISTRWQSNLMDLNTAVMVLSSQTLDQAKNWFVFIEDSDEWINILESPLILTAFQQRVEAKAPAAVKPEPAAEPVLEFKPEPVLVRESASVLETEISQETVIVPLSSIEHFEQLPFETINTFADNLAESQANTETEDQETQYNETSLFNEEIEIAEPQLAVVEEVDFSEDVSNKRAHPRYEIKLRVIIKSEKNTFLAFTKDVSLGGLNLLSTIPEHILNGEAEIYITAPDQKNNIMFTCSPVLSNTAKTRIQFTNVDPGKLKMLSAWLDHFVVSNQKKAVS